MPPMDTELDTATLQLAAEHGTVTNALINDRLQCSHQRQSHSRLHLIDAGLFERVTEAESKIAKKGKEFADQSILLTPDIVSTCVKGKLRSSSRSGELLKGSNQLSLLKRFGRGRLSI